MASIIGNIIKNNADLTDDVILTNMLASSTGTASAYFYAAISSTTPELRAMFSSALTQIMGEHHALTELAVKHGWEKPYNPPVQQLTDVYKKSTVDRQ